jgi:hypothetical protein
MGGNCFAGFGIIFFGIKVFLLFVLLGRLEKRGA